MPDTPNGPRPSEFPEAAPHNAASSASPPVLSIVIVNWNTADLLDACLASIYRYTAGIYFEIIVFDNASADHSREVLGKYPEVSAIFHPENIGFAAGNNRAAECARGEFLLLLNPDTEIRENIFPEIIAYLKESPYRVLGPRLLLPDGSVQMTSGNFPGLWRMLVQNIYSFLKMLRLSALIPFLALLSRVPAGQFSGMGRWWDPEQVHPVDWVSGACMLLRRDDFMTVGRFDEDFTLYAEEFELCYRLAKAGKTAVYYGRVAALHHSAASTRQFRERSHILRTQAMLRFYEKFRPGAEVLVYRLVVIVANVLGAIWHQLLALPAAGENREIHLRYARTYWQVAQIYSGWIRPVKLPG